MFDQTLTFLSDVVDAARNAFLAPGEFLVGVLERLAPNTVEILVFGSGGTLVTFFLSLAAWTALVIAGLLTVRLCRNVVRQVNAVVMTLIFHVKSRIGMLKTQLIWKYRKYFPHRAEASSVVEHDEFDDIDIAVLRSVSGQAPGFATSAPELAEKLSLRPAQIQHRLEKLRKNNMVQFVIGSTEGFQNYTPTSSGQALAAMWQRH